MNQQLPCFTCTVNVSPEFQTFLEQTIRRIVREVVSAPPSSPSPPVSRGHAVMPDEDQLLDVKAAAKLLQVSLKTLYNLTKHEGLPSIKVGSLVRYKRRDLLTWIEGRREPSR